MIKSIIFTFNYYLKKNLQIKFYFGTFNKKKYFKDQP